MGLVILIHFIHKVMNLLIPDLKKLKWNISIFQPAICSLQYVKKSD